jgi:hypothetical protein
MSVSVECNVLSGRGLCDGLIAYPEETLPSVVCLCYPETSTMRWPMPK